MIRYHFQTRNEKYFISSFYLHTLGYSLLFDKQIATDNNDMCIFCVVSQLFHD